MSSRQSFVSGLLVIFVTLGGATRASADGCMAAIDVGGLYRATLTERPNALPVLEFRFIRGPSVTGVRTRRPQACDRHSSRDTELSFSSDGVDARFFHLLNEIRREVGVEGPGSATPQTFSDFQHFLTQASLSIVSDEAVSGAVGLIFDLLGRIELELPQQLLFTTTKLLLTTYLEGGDLDALTKEAIKEALDYAQSLGVEEDELNFFVDAVKALANVIETMLEERLEPQSMTGSSSDADCEYFMEAFWNPRTGAFTARFTKTCGDVRGLDRVTFTVPAAKPGDAAVGTIGAVNALGNPVQLSAVTVTGLEAVMEAGATYQVNGLPGFAPTVNFVVARPRRDDTYPLQATVTDVRGARQNVTTNFRVLNVAPQITEVSPDGTDADPDERMLLSHVNVTVKDDNADRRNEPEVSERSLRLGGHPSGLNTTRRFDGTDSVGKNSFDGTSGTYVFEFTRDGGTVRRPHRHDTFTTRISLQDNNGQNVFSPVTLDVNDVSPEPPALTVEQSFVHARDGQRITIRGRLIDANGWEDIETAMVDATDAGGSRYELGAGLQRVRQDEDYIEVRVDPFEHTDVPGEHSIPESVSDERHTATATDVLHVGNTEPSFGATGFIYETGLSATAPSNLCPNQAFTVGATVHDPEGDAFTVTATIVETGAMVTLTLNLGDQTYTGTLQAPPTPGTYTLRIDAVETQADGKSAPPQFFPLVVVPCGPQADTVTSPPTGTQLLYDAVTANGTTSEVAMVLRREGGRTLLETSILSTGKGASYRTWEPDNVSLVLGKEKLKPTHTSNYYIAKESALAGVAPILFAAIGSQYERDAVRAQASEGQSCHASEEPGAEQKGAQRSTLGKAIDRAGMAVGLSLLAASAKGEITGLRATFDVTGREHQLQGAKLKAVIVNTEQGGLDLTHAPKRADITVPVNFQ